jgi:antitoxin HicB
MKYLAVIEPTKTGFSGFFPDLDARVIVAMPTLESTKKHLSEGLALYLRDNADAPAPRFLKFEDIPDLDETDNFITELVEPAPLNPVSLEIASALKSAGLRPADLARKLKVTRASVSRLTDPFYFGHSVAVLRRVAEALGANLTVTFEVPKQRRAA